VQRWNLPEGWVISKHAAHAALVSEADSRTWPLSPSCSPVMPENPAGRAADPLS